MNINTLSIFDKRLTAFWATTYTFEPDLFDEFIFPRIGDPPLNANILVDASRIDSLWANWQDEPWRFRRINRDYLVRPVDFPSSAFHPKTYLLAGRTSATLLVGSGNLTINGLLEGKEVFSQFDSADEVGAEAIASWQRWMNDLVRRLNDVVLTERWSRFLQACPWLPKTSKQSSFVHNLYRPLLEQFLEALPDPVEELHVMSPFFDARCEALAQLLRGAAPKRLILYLPHDVSVDGNRLAEVVEATPTDVTVYGFDQSEFIHAKLYGGVSGDRGVLMSGSPNCSRPALLATADNGNAEVAVVTEASTETVRDAFVPGGWSLQQYTPDALHLLVLRPHSSSSHTWPVRLGRATLSGDGVITVQYNHADAAYVRAVSVDGTELSLIGARGTETIEQATFAWLLDGDGNRISNGVPVDHADRLASWLQDRRADQGRPPELSPADVDSEIGEMLVRLNEHFIFDIDEVLAGTGRNSVEAESSDEDDGSRFWDTFDPEVLRFDPRSPKYTRLLTQQSFGHWSNDHEIAELLESMIGRFPGEQQKIHAYALDGSRTTTHHPVGVNIQRRVVNLLTRWAKALNDGRFGWIDPAAPVVNYHLLIRALATCWARRFITHKQASVIILTLLQSVLGSDKRCGYILLLPKNERAEVLSRLSQEDIELTAALIYTALDPSSDWRDAIFEWQPYIVAGIENGIIAAGDNSVDYFEALHSRSSEQRLTVTPAAIDDHLQYLATFLNDTQWCKLQEEELGFSNVTIHVSHGAGVETWPYRVTAAGVTTVRIDPRIVALVTRLLTYKSVQGVIVEAVEPMASGTIPQRLSVSLDNVPSVYASDRTGEYSCGKRLTKGWLRELETLGLGFVEILDREP